jgi:hypothetical protein
MVIKHVDNHVESPLKKQCGGGATSFCVTEIRQSAKIYCLKTAAASCYRRAEYTAVKST